MKDFKNLIASFMFHCQYEKNLSSHSLKAYSIDLRQFNEFISTSPATENIIDKTIIRDYLKELFQNNKPKTIKRKIATIKSFMNYLEYEEVIEISPFYKMKINIREGKQLPKTIELKKIKRLFTYLYKKKENSGVSIKDKYSYKTLIRDIAVIELLFASGIRVAELSYLKCSDINFSKGLALIKGKGNRERIIPIPNMAIMAALNEYYELYKEDIATGEYFFINRLNSRLSEQSIRLMINRYGKESKLQQHITPHMFRHSVATLLLENGVDIRYIQNILGHSTINTTQIYAQVNEAPKRRILRLKHPRVKFNFGKYV
jgi:integrase/recombinase XerD